MKRASKDTVACPFCDLRHSEPFCPDCRAFMRFSDARTQADFQVWLERVIRRVAAALVDARVSAVEKE